MARKPNHVAAANGATTVAKRERRGLWSPEEDERLFTQITCYGVSTWSSVAQLAGLRRSGKSCRLRWMNYLRPDLRKEPISEREEETIISLKKSLGNRWSAIAAELPGRTDNEIKNYWNSRIKKRLNAVANAGPAGNSTSDEEKAPAAGEKEECTNNTVAAVAPSTIIPARFPVFACQLLDGGALSTTISHQQNGRSEESQPSVGVGGEDDDACYTGCGGSGRDMIFDPLAFHELNYTDNLLVDVPGVMDAWESELFSSGGSLSWFN